LPAEAGLAVLGALGVAVLALLWWIARLHPYIGLAMGIAFLAVPVLQWIFFERRFFQSEGSAAGLFIFLVYAGFGVVCASLGTMFVADAGRRIARGESGTALLTRGQAAGLIVVVLASVAGLLGHRYHASKPYKPDRAVHTQDRVERVVTVREAYPLTWKSAHGAPALRLAIPAGDLPREAGEPEPTIQETRDGPLVLRLLLPDVPDGAMELHRDDYFVGDGILAGLDGPAGRDPASPDAFWVRRDGGGWKLLGAACKDRTAADLPAVRCHKPEAPFARWAPALFNLENVRLHATRESQACHLAFRYRERIVKVTAQGRCFTAPSLAVLDSAVALLDRLGRDSEAAPDAATRIGRASEGVARCEDAANAAPPPGTAGMAAFEALRRAEGICSHAQRLAIAELGIAPADASALALRALEAAGDRDGRKHLPAIDALLRGLASSGRGESRDALRAHVLRVARGGADSDSVEAVLTLAPKQLAADDPLFDRVSRLSLGEAYAKRQVALLQAWHEKAESAAPGSDLALKARYRACGAQVSANVERESLQACADELMAAWERRIVDGKSFDIFDSEGELAAALARMYYAYGFTSHDFAAGAAGVRLVREKAAARLPKDAAHASLDGFFNDLEGQLAAKLSGRPAGGR
jgi:hypothetical protein